MIELDCPRCETPLLVAPTPDELTCRDCAVTVAIVDDDEWLALAA
jgi:uncharacterized protein YbaR (Trm112 family)